MKCIYVAQHGGLLNAPAGQLVVDGQIFDSLTVTFKKRELVLVEFIEQDDPSEEIMKLWGNSAAMLPENFRMATLYELQHKLTSGGIGYIGKNEVVAFTAYTFEDDLIMMLRPLSTRTIEPMVQGEKYVLRGIRRTFTTEQGKERVRWMIGSERLNEDVLELQRMFKL